MEVAAGRAADGGVHVEDGVPVPDRIVEHGDEGREVDHDSCEGMQHPDGDGALVHEDDEPLGEADDPVVSELRQADAEASGRARVEHGDLAAVVRADPVAVAEGDPVAWEEVRSTEGGVARVARAGAPAGADGAEDDVVYHVAGQQQAGDEVN
jgi:hypothetical protein